MLLICIASLLVCSAADFSLIVSNASVSEPLGSSTVLSCALSPSLNARTFEIQWYKKTNDVENMVLLYQDQNVQESIQDVQYRGRASLIGELDKGNVSLKLNNLIALDGGEYTCYVKTYSWYEKASINLVVTAFGSTPLLLYHEAGEKVNVTCKSHGWSPKPTLTWRDSAGQELPNSHTYYRTDPKGLVNVSSWMLYSLSNSEWISCTVGLNPQEIKESRIVPLKGFWREAFIATLVLSLIVLITFTILLILISKGLIPHCSSHKNAKAAVNSNESLMTETVPLNTTENTKQGISSQSEASEPTKKSTEEKQATRRLNTTENTKLGISSLCGAQNPTEERPAFMDRHKVSLTLDPSTAPECLKVSRDGKSVSFKPNSKSKDKFPHVMSKEELGSGQHYWEVMVWDKTSTAKRKKSWCVGVTQKPHTDNALRALCYEEGTGFYTNTHDFSKIPIDNNMTKLGLHLNCERKSITFYNADKTSNNHIYTFHIIPQGTYVVFLSPGVRDKHPVKILTEHEISASVKPVH